MEIDILGLKRPAIINELSKHVHPLVFPAILNKSTATLRAMLAYFLSSEEEQNDDRTPPHRCSDACRGGLTLVFREGSVEGIRVSGGHGGGREHA